MDGSDPLKHRLGLWARSEKALGLPSVNRVEFAQKPPQNPAVSGNGVPPKPQAAVPPARPTIKAPQPIPSPAPAARAQPSFDATLPVLETPFDSPVLSRDEKIRALDELNRGAVTGCVRCGLSRTRTQTVFGEGDPDAQIMFIGEGPGRDEDASGRPFVGKAGQKLNDMIRGMGLAREQVYICNIVKCRAFFPDIGKDRPPTEEETSACTPYLVRQVEVIRPKVIVTLGLPSTRYLLKSKASMTSMRGRWQAWRGIKVMPTWHPAYVLRNYTEQTRREVWEDLKKVLTELSLPIPKRSGKQD